MAVVHKRYPELFTTKTRRGHYETSGTKLHPSVVLQLWAYGLDVASSDLALEASLSLNRSHPLLVIMQASTKTANDSSHNPSNGENGPIRSVLSHGLAIATGSVRLALAKQRKSELKGALKKLDELTAGLRSLQQSLQGDDLNWEFVHRVEHHLSADDLQKRIRRLKLEHNVVLGDLHRLQTLDYFTPAAATTHRNLREFMQRCAELERDYIHSSADVSRGHGSSRRPEDVRDGPVFAKDDAEPWDAPQAPRNSTRKELSIASYTLPICTSFNILILDL
ncbi:hypothetical protein PsYK624_087140 [Phanerochaete sordida]|uniref:Uncharacterized protein n=1 Tax=Phanerochaete sordida TaxID=48140 RepID=A0A9P3LFF1_9APHY|nr:hypothetical protein PsYK624_087140 [Phanerochaete sordida]